MTSGRRSALVLPDSMKTLGAPWRPFNRIPAAVKLFILTQVPPDSIWARLFCLDRSLQEGTSVLPRPSSLATSPHRSPRYRHHPRLRQPGRPPSPPTLRQAVFTRLDASICLRLPALMKAVGRGELPA